MFFSINSSAFWRNDLTGLSEILPVDPDSGVNVIGIVVVVVIGDNF